MAQWEHFSHGSDIGIRGKGHSLAEAFEMIGMSLTALMVKPEEITPQEVVKAEIHSDNLDFLLYDWVNRLIFETATKHLIFANFQVSLSQDPPRLLALMSGEKIDPSKHDLGVEVKGATFTELKVQKDNGLWLCQCIVDV
ncbi:MAG: archease [Pseudobdellovibrionaceae bacterium]